MTVTVINAYLTSGIGTVFGCLAYHSTGGFSLATEQAMVWDLEEYDEGNWHSTSTNTSRFVVPFGVTHARITSSLGTASSGNPLITQKLNGADFNGQARAEARDGQVGFEATNGMSAIVAVTEGDYFETFGHNQAGSTSSTSSTWTQVETIPSTTRRVLCRKSTNQSLAAGTDTLLTWDVEDYDTDAFHSNTVNNSRLTAPVTGRYRVILNVVAASASGQFVIFTRLNGADYVGRAANEVDSTGIEHCQAVSAVLQLNAGDYLEAFAFHTSATSVTAGSSTWFSMEQIPSTYKCCLVTKSATQSLSAGTSTNVTFNTEAYDDANMHDNVTTNTRLVVPAGCTKARATFGLRMASSAGQLAGNVTKNGSSFVGAPRYDTETAGADTVNAIGAWVPVVPGDYFELVAFSTTADTVAASPFTFFCLECQ